LECLIEDFLQSLAVFVLCTVEHITTTIKSDNITGTGNGLSVYRERERERRERDMDRDRARDRDRQRETETETVSDRDRQNRYRDRNRDRATEDVKMNRYRASERATERYRELRVKSKSTFSALSLVFRSCLCCSPPLPRPSFLQWHGSAICPRGPQSTSRLPCWLWY
jgi:hypothetical protein